MDKLNLQILTPQQQNILDLLSNSKLSNSFYLSGGTALIIAYIPYRYSDDLDFFSETDFEFKDILSYLMTLKKQLNYKTLTLGQTLIGILCSLNLIIAIYLNSSLHTTHLCALKVEQN